MCFYELWGGGGIIFTFILVNKDLTVVAVYLSLGCYFKHIDLNINKSILYTVQDKNAIVKFFKWFKV